MSSMVLETWDEPDSVIYRLTIPRSEWTLAELDGFDRRLIKECEGSDSVADKLLALERITKRIEEANNREVKRQENEKTLS